MPQDSAEVGNLQDLLSRVGEGLDEFLKFEHPDAFAHQDAWKAALTTELPQQGIGIDEVTRELVEHIIPNGSPVPKPGLTAFITTGATSASVLASTAASIASAASPWLSERASRWSRFQTSYWRSRLETIA